MLKKNFALIQNLPKKIKRVNVDTFLKGLSNQATALSSAKLAIHKIQLDLAWFLTKVLAQLITNINHKIRNLTRVNKTWAPGK